MIFLFGQNLFINFGNFEISFLEIFDVETRLEGFEVILEDCEALRAELVVEVLGDRVG